MSEYPQSARIPQSAGIPESTGVQEREWIPPHSTYVAVRYTRDSFALIIVMLVQAALILGFKFFPSLLPVSESVQYAIYAVIIAILLWSAWWMLTLVRRTRALGYCVQPDYLSSRKGLLFRQEVSIPYGRLQYMDIKSGPLERKAGLCRLQIRTAGVAESYITIYGLKFEQAHQLRTLLLERAEERMVEL
ncbi:MAG: PH domain-containing protein [Rothia sp. (in: high G+C Gram-positive bacteria)]|uniref:PH domain-containing protein n=1 Tax=Rothia sp. (in: high G+C Gram-positive bacteria) TaxID=1885016 RepID=UPI0026E03000|nr:PH domain-containing protein [Rothia sp. (in: high G+C Gram-positive bacteria)]MDO5749732.1 PH domain-containing protein [Rothia sp. (in: high G+C Gram-positive bacteria)]